MPMLLDLTTGATEPAPEAFDGIVISPDAGLPTLEEGIPDSAAVVRLEAANFKDGRVYSRARLLRERFGFRGVIEVAGHVLPDQASFLRHSGVTRIVLESAERVPDFTEALDGSPHLYQRGFPATPALPASGDA